MIKAGNTAKAFDVTVEKLVYGGLGFARHQGKVIFIPFSVPGDRLKVRAVEEKKTFVRAEIIKILKSGKGRVQPPCPHFGVCGGCQLQQMDYGLQVDAKGKILQEIFHHRFPETRDLVIAMHACPQPLRYRSRARVQMRGCGPKAAVGFYRHRSHAVEDVEHCPLFRDSLNEALSALRQYRIKVETEAAAQEMDVACSEEEGTWATAHTGSDVNEGAAPFLGTRRIEDVILRRNVGDFLYMVTATAFFQANDFVLPQLITVVKDLAQIGRHNAALDLFSGVGLFSLPLARIFEKVVAVESSKASCGLCISNAAAMGYGNIQTVCADAAAWMNSETASGSCVFDLVVLDPPRTGAGGAVMESIRKCEPETIIYVSCDPQTMSRDIAALSPHDYRIDFIQGLDMFPQTYHFETVARLIRK